jgi:hypothetical protein
LVDSEILRVEVLRDDQDAHGQGPYQARGAVAGDRMANA